MLDVVGCFVFDWDGIVDFYVWKYEDFEVVFLDLEYIEWICLDEVKFIDMDIV